ncbi:F-box/LRR-repeat protein 17 isoform X4 [Gopherus flavomarginatus]|uniref:F-box/LRR-repeat protein 17 isoform X4 n=1 Tax=Gopherus flavomarginatus TaxID=286002 RepID=UPI0021CC2750|nr:F-box/LRR-repeat protein 17 isoform X4 [Gopherus flavomarginatus]
MGHLLSREGTSLSRERSRCRRRGRKVPPRSRSCFLRGPCMLCFIVHGASPPAPEQPLPGRDSPPLCAGLSSAEQRAARRLLHLSPAAWEQRGPCQRLLFSGLLPPPVRAFLGSARPPGEPAPDMVCKRKGAGLPACPPCKQPRCGAAAPPEPEAAACQCPSEQQLCPLPCASGRAAGGGGPLPGALSGESGGVGELAAEVPPQEEEEEEEGNEPDRQEPLENPSECCRESLQPLPPDINQLPPSILLKIFSNLSLNERCLSASLVCKYWHDLCLDFHFWKQLDLSNRQQLGSKCKELKDIHFGQCYKISDEGMIIIAKGCLKLQRIYMQENKLVTDHSVKAFAEHCPELQYVGFMGCSVTSKGVIHLTNLRNLSSLDLRHITELDNETVMEIVKRCKNLSSLNLCLNWIINDRCVEVIAKEGQNLKELYLVSCKITDYALIAIGRYSMTIETVDVGWCKEITDQGATQIAQSSKSLRYLGLMRCDKVSEATVEQLVQQYPHITFSTVLQDCKRTLERAYQMGWTPSMSSAS